jgi:AraC-like DNA-binding protein
MIERDDQDEPYDNGTFSHAPTAALPADLIRVIDWVRGNLAESISLERLAAVAGVPPRTLEAHFRSYLGTTPLGWVRRMRLVNTRRELSRGPTHARVTDIALASGFSQLGRFAAHYRSAFGEPPSVTLRRGRRGSLHSGTNATDNEAFRLTWQAMPQVFAIAPRECSEALDVLEKAQRLAPDYGLPVALAAWCWGQRAAHGFSATPENDRDHGLQLVAKVCELAPNDALALTLASGALTLAHRLEEADRLLERVLDLDPWLPYAWVRRGWASVYMGDPEAAYRELTIALHLSPLGPMRHIASIGMGCAHFACGQYERAALWVQGETQAFPGAVWADRIAVAAAVHAGAAGAARRMARRLMRNDPNLTVASARRAWPFPPAFMTRLADGLKLAGIPRT